MAFAPPLIVGNRTRHPGRICPGGHLALRTVYLFIACVLSVFDIGPVLDDEGNPRMPKVEFSSATVR
jgi:hypothetical protein